MKAVADNPTLTPAAKWTVTGTPVLKVDGANFVTGQHKYTSDVKLPGMLHGRIVRPSTFRAKLASIDAKTAEAMPGVKVEHDGEFVGVVAP
jgi:nicotinate dehydrogenase subunit B